jgi:hypothetical protein
MRALAKRADETGWSFDDGVAGAPGDAELDALTLLAVADHVETALRQGYDRLVIRNFEDMPATLRRAAALLRSTTPSAEPISIEDAFTAGWFACDPDADGEDRCEKRLQVWLRAMSVPQPVDPAGGESEHMIEAIIRLAMSAVESGYNTIGTAAHDATVRILALAGTPSPSMGTREPNGFALEYRTKSGEWSRPTFWWDGVAYTIEQAQQDFPDARVSRVFFERVAAPQDTREAPASTEEAT